MYSCAPTRRETWHETRGKTRKHRLAGVWDKTRDEARDMGTRHKGAAAAGRARSSVAGCIAGGPEALVVAVWQGLSWCLHGSRQPRMTYIFVV